MSLFHSPSIEREFLRINGRQECVKISCAVMVVQVFKDSELIALGGCRAIRNTILNYVELMLVHALMVGKRLK